MKNIKKSERKLVDGFTRKNVIFIITNTSNIMNLDDKTDEELISLWSNVTIDDLDNAIDILFDDNPDI